MKYVNKNDWTSSDDLVLEDSALLVVKSTENRLVIAGPGAGKTELLAQRASYLLQTNECKAPQRILAISFKKDAAANLLERVQKRCGKELALRFESMTYDAYFKNILDRFINSLPDSHKPNSDYQVVMQERDSNGIDKLSFENIASLAKLILDTNPFIVKSIQLTYSHVFLDEFQDTTTPQYDMVKICFQKSKAILTAVGDGKQRIMLWAGARKTIFNDFILDFNADREELIMNHRSAPRLVAIQKSMYANLNERDSDIQHANKWNVDEGTAYIRYFPDVAIEATVLTSKMKSLLDAGAKPRDICILVKQTPDQYCTKIIKTLKKQGILARNEVVLQDLLKSDFVTLLLALFKLTLEERNVDLWDYVYNVFSELNELNVDTPSSEYIAMTQYVEELVEELIPLYQTITEKGDLKNIIKTAIRGIGYKKLAKLYPKYQDKHYFKERCTQFHDLLWKEFSDYKNWDMAINSFEGTHSIPIMTIHKSKGLEFDSIFFVGLEEAAFWSFSRQSQEDKCAFFVALSRAKKRVDFTFCRGRETQFTNQQSNAAINELYEMLRKSGVVEEVEY